MGSSSGSTPPTRELWKEFGISPAEASRLTKAGETAAAATARLVGGPASRWTRYPAWLGAGLTPEEAAEQRAKGITADRAAVMRALRDPDKDQ